jgi:hypothetical protein
VYDAFGVIGTIFVEIDGKMLIFFERVVPIAPNAWYFLSDSAYKVYSGCRQNGANDHAYV